MKKCDPIAIDFPLILLIRGSPHRRSAHLKGNPGPQHTRLRFRMKKLSLATLAIAVAAAFTAAALARNNNETQVLDQISGYRQWTKVNADPVKVEVPVTKTDPAFPVGETLV